MEGQNTVGTNLCLVSFQPLPRPLRDVDPERGASGSATPAQGHPVGGPFESLPQLLLRLPLRGGV